jgi:hypothetical protein
VVPNACFLDNKRIQEGARRGDQDKFHAGAISPGRTFCRCGQEPERFIRIGLISDVQLERSPIVGLAVGKPSMEQAELGGSQCLFGWHITRQFLVQSRH